MVINRKIVIPHCLVFVFLMFIIISLKFICFITMLTIKAAVNWQGDSILGGVRVAGSSMFVKTMQCFARFTTLGANIIYVIYSIFL